MAETQTVKSNKDKISERLSAKYPDKQFADDEAMYGQIIEDYDENEKALNGYKEQDDKFAEMFSKYPDSARFIADMANGVNPWVAIVEQIGVDGITDMFENPQYKEALAEAQQKYVDKMARNKELEDEYDKNIADSLDKLSAYQEKNGLSDEQVDKIFEFLWNLAQNSILGKYDEASFDIARKALNYDTDVENARTEGEVAGRNAKINAKMASTKGDGMPDVQGANNSPVMNARKGSIFDLADQAK